jgi:hypothetical protein
MVLSFMIVLCTHPVDFVEHVRLQDDTADDSLAWGGLHLHLHITKEEELLSCDGWTISKLGYGEFCPFRDIIYGAGSSLPVCPCGRCSFREVDIVLCWEARLGRTIGYTICQYIERLQKL